MEPITPAGPLGPSLFPAPVQTGPAPYSYLALDLETTDGSPEEAEHWMRLRYLPPANYSKPESIGKHFLDKLADKKAKLALLDSAPIVCVSLKSDDELRCLHCLEAGEPRQIAGGLVEGFATMREMLAALRALLDARCTPETLLVGHNILGFDLRKLRWAYVKHGLRMPFVLQGTDQPVFDTMLKYASLFTVGGERGLFVSLDDLLIDFGIASHKGEIDGSQVPGLVAAKRYDDLVQYALLDVLAEAELFLRMSGQIEDLPTSDSEQGAA